MIGGLARIGIPASIRYHDQVKTVQRMEKEVLGKVLTTATRV
jgi:hypothetical protein